MGLSRYPTELVSESLEYIEALNRQGLLPPVTSYENIKPVVPQRVISPSASSEVFVMDMDTILAVIYAHKLSRCARICALNSASYKIPGGGFTSGMRAQEEAVCHCTDLFLELSKHNSWYAGHKATLNRGLYHNECILSKGILVHASDICKYLQPAERFQIDVLTCAAPNWQSILKYSPHEINLARQATVDRIHYVCNVLGQFEYDYLILGAYGCGVFRNDPKLVAESFKEALFKTGTAKNIIFAIPDKTSENYVAFERVFGEHCQV